MRGILSAVLGLLAIGLYVGSITMNWPASPSDWSSDSYAVGWGRYMLALVLAILALLVCWWPDISRTYRALKRRGGDGEGLATYGIGHKQARLEGGKNQWPKRQLS